MKSAQESIPFNMFVYLLDVAYTRLQGCVEVAEAVNKGELAQDAAKLSQRALTIVAGELDRLSTRTIVFDNEVPSE